MTGRRLRHRGGGVRRPVNEGKRSPRVLALAVTVAGLSSCVYVPPPGEPYPAPPPPYVAPVPPPPYVTYRRCGPGWHWVRAHRNRAGRWVRGHCAPNRW